MNENILKIRRTIDVQSTGITITEHTGTHTTDDYVALCSEVYTVDNFTDAMKERCMMHGLAQKLSDCTAGKSDAKGHTTESRFADIDELFNQLDGDDGTWTKAKTGGAGKLSQSVIKTKMDALGLSDEQYELAAKMGLIKA